MKTKHIEVVPYNPEWSKQFEIEAEVIQQALRDNCIAIYHIGSTSVPKLAAKPKIDIIAVVKDLAKTISSLEAVGIKHRGEYNIPLHYGFSKRGKVDVNLHVFEEGHPEIELNLLFRDYLCAHPDVRDDYARLKEILLQDETSFMKQDSPFANYTLRKGDFIRSVLKKAGFDRLRMLKCNDETEWKAAKAFRQKYFFDKVPIEDPYTWTFNHVDHEHLAFYKGTEIIGYAHIQLWPNHRAAIRIIVVDEHVRGQEFGGQFLALIEKWLKARGYKSLHTESSPAAVSFYEKHGYSKMPFEDPDGYESDPQDTPMGKVL